MNKQTPHIVGVGNALVDVVAAVTPEVIARHDLKTGGMYLVDAAAAQSLFEEVGPGIRQSGGSVANSMAHLTQLGLSGTYLGKTASDDLGTTFAEEMRAMGIDAPIAPGPASETGTGRCVVLVTPDGERTMSTYLGAAVTLRPSDLTGVMPERFDILFVEGYLWDAPQGAAVIETAAQAAKTAGAKVAMTPSDAGCVERNRDVMLNFIAQHVDILIGNHVEIGALAGQDDVGAAMDWALCHVGIAAVTEHEKGALVADATGRHRVDAVAVPRVLDTTGAGDAFASGFLGGLALGHAIDEAGRMGADCAARVLGHYGARDGAAARAISIPAA